MGWEYFVFDFFVITLAVIFADEIRDRYKAMKKKAIKNCLCDVCGKPRVTRRTPDKLQWVCRSCMKLYKEENL